MPDSAATSRNHRPPNAPRADGLRAVLDSLATTGLPFYTMSDVESAEFCQARIRSPAGSSLCVLLAVRRIPDDLVVQDAPRLSPTSGARKEPG
jgi:hypothetical protein